MILATAMAISCLWSSIAAAQCEQAEYATLTASEGEPGDFFGSKVAIFGDWAIVGAPESVVDGVVRAGAAYVYQRDGASWIEQTKLVAEVPGMGNARFGDSVAIQGDAAVVGDPLNSVVYDYRWDGLSWHYKEQVRAVGVNSLSSFGVSVSLSIDALVVGAPRTTVEGAVEAGAGFVFRRGDFGWVQVAALVGTQSAAIANAGAAVVIDQQNVVVGAPGNSLAGVFDVTFFTDATDCNSNSRNDSCDLVAGTSDDCQSNGVLDECDEANGVSGDCNENGRLDVCDITAGISADCDHNGVPDDCSVAVPVLFAADEIGGELFGRSVAIDGVTAIVGAPNDDNANGVNAGAAYVFRREGDLWVPQQKLIGTTAGALSEFGVSVGISGDTLVVGAWEVDTGGEENAGAAYVFRFNGIVWVEEEVLTASDGAASDSFGAAVAIDGDRIVVGAPRNDTEAGVDAGSAYVFHRDADQWIEERTLTAADAQLSDRFGSAVAIEASLIVVGAPFEDAQNVLDAGSAYVFRQQGDEWVDGPKLFLNDGSNQDRFGTSIAIDHEKVIVGAPKHDNVNGIDAGAAFVYGFIVDNWIREGTLIGPGGSSGGHLGTSVDISGDLALAGAPDLGVPSFGGIFAFQLVDGEWSPLDTYSNAPAGFGSALGTAVALSGDLGIAGAPLVDHEGHVDSGVVFVTDLLPPDCQCPTGVFTFANPVDGTVDARQPHSILSSDQLQGIQTIQVTGLAGAQRSCWSMCETFPSTFPNEITEVTHQGNTYTISLARPITTGEVTTISYADDQGGVTVGRFFAHPGNVDASSTTSSLDILALIDNLNGVATPAYGLYSTDIDRSGVAQPADILRLIDLLNGAGAFDPWLGATSPSSSGCP